MRLREIGTSTRLLAVFGDPVEHSLSPAMHNAAIASLGLDYVYLAFRVRLTDLARALDGVRSMGIPGVNLTIPLKRAACELVDHLSRDACDAGAVNTVVNRDGVLTGHNTDGDGFIASLEEDLGMHPAGLRVCILGSGGAARGISLSLARSGAERIVFAVRTVENGRQLCSLVTKRYPVCRADVVNIADRVQLSRVLSDTDLLVNATPVGMHPFVDRSIDVDLGSLPEHAGVADLIYNPSETLFLRSAKALGYRTMNGVGMLAHQGALAFRLWTGALPDVGIMRQSIMNCLARGSNSVT